MQASCACLRLKLFSCVCLCFYMFYPPLWQFCHPLGIYLLPWSHGHIVSGH